ncbi:hypothetical protein Ancab_019216 [Ancistrocladus abbreviatus]
MIMEKSKGHSIVEGFWVIVFLFSSPWDCLFLEAGDVALGKKGKGWVGIEVRPVAMSIHSRPEGAFKGLRTYKEVVASSKPMVMNSGFAQGLQSETTGLNFEKPMMVGALGNGYVSLPREQHNGTLMEEETTPLKRREALAIADPRPDFLQEAKVLRPTMLGPAKCGHASGHADKPTGRALNSC